MNQNQGEPTGMNDATRSRGRRTFARTGEISHAAGAGAEARNKFQPALPKFRIGLLRVRPIFRGWGGKVGGGRIARSVEKVGGLEV